MLRYQKACAWTRTRNLRFCKPLHFHCATQAIAVEGIEPTTPSSQEGVIPFNYTAYCEYWDSNPDPQRGRDLESRAYTNFAIFTRASVGN